MRTRVVVLLNSFAVGGAEVFAVDCARTMDATRFDVSLCILRGPESLVPRVKAAGLAYTRLPAPTIPALREFLRVSRPDVLQTHHVLAGVFARAAGRMEGTPVVVSTEQCVIQPFPWSLRAINDVTIWLADANVFITEGVRDSFAGEGIWSRQLPPDRLHVIPNGVDIAAIDRRTRGMRARHRQAFGLDDDTFLVGNVGRLVDQKGQSYLLQGFRDVKRQLAQARLMVVGCGPLDGALKAQARQLGIADSVIFTGEREDAVELMTAFDVFAFPTNFEGLGVVLLEAMVVGVPVIASAVAGVTDVVQPEQSGLLIPARSPSDLTTAVLRIAGSPQLRQALASGGRQRVESAFSLPAAAGRYETLYERLLARKRSRMAA